MKIVADTSVLIDFLRRGNGKKSLFARLLALKHDITVSFITVAELYSGKSLYESTAKKQAVEEILSGVEVVIPSLHAAKEAGRLRAIYQLSLADAFIVALALEQNLLLATLDVKSIAQIESLKLYKDFR